MFITIEGKWRAGGEEEDIRTGRWLSSAHRHGGGGGGGGRREGIILSVTINIFSAAAEDVG